MRLAHETKVPPYTGAYPEGEMWENYLKATGGVGDLALAKKVVSESSSVLEWMMQHDVRFQPAISGTLHLGRTNAWFLGGGKAMMNSLYRSAETIGVDICYEAEVVDLDIRDRFFHGATVLLGGAERVKVSASTVIAAAGGFQSNLKWMREVWGAPADNFLIRGAPFDTGTVLKLLLEKGVESFGDPTQAHMVPIDARSPKMDGGIVTRVDCVTLGIVVNRSGKRFYDEGEDFWPMRYAIWGRLVAQQEEQIAYVLIDSKTIEQVHALSVSCNHRRNHRRSGGKIRPSC